MEDVNHDCDDLIEIQTTHLKSRKSQLRQMELITLLRRQEAADPTAL